MALSLSGKPKQIFDRSVAVIDKVETLFVEAKVIFPEFQPDVTGIKEQLANPFSIFICGEFNSGKSSLLNQLGGDNIAQVGILPTTQVIQPYNPEGFGGLVFIDSPGTNSIIDEHQELTENYLKQADIILFITSVERPLTRSEQDFLTLVDRTWARKVIVCINKIDLATVEEVELVTNHVSEGLKEIFAEAPPLFAISTKTGDGLERLKTFLLEFLAEEEKLKLKLQGPQNSLLVYLERLVEKNRDIQGKLAEEKEIFDRTQRRIQERLEEYKLLFAVFQGNIEDLFRNLMRAINKVVDKKISFLSVAKRRITNEDDLLESKLKEAIEEVKLDDNIKEIFQDATKTFIQYRDRIVREATEDIKSGIKVGGDTVNIPTLDTSNVDIKEMSEAIKIAADKGLNNCGKLGIVAAVTGFGGQILFTAASVDASAFILSVVFGLLSANALPRERQKVKESLEETFNELKQSYTNTLWKSLATELNDCLKQFTDIIQPVKEDLEKKIELSKSIEEKVTANKKEINNILEDLNKI